MCPPFLKLCVGLEVSRIIAVDNSTLNSSFGNTYDVMRSRALQTGFSAGSSMSSFKTDPFKLSRYKELTDNFVVSLPEITGLATLFHGNSEAVCWKVASAGFVNLH